MLTISSLLMISSLFGSNHTIKHKKMIDGLNLKNIDSVMFVAHPDDETIWGGSHLLKKHYLVVCITNGNNKTRRKEFMNVMKATHNTGVMFNYPDKTNGQRDNWDKARKYIKNEVHSILSKKKWTTVVTHNQVVDDDKDIREVIQVLLSSEGYEVIEASNGKEALELVDDDTDLIILDVMMPEMNGYQACVLLREKTKAPILFLTAKGQDSDKTLGFSSGGDDYLTKPFSYNELNGRVKALLRRYHVYQGKGSTQEKQITYKTGNIEVNSAKRTASIDGEKLNLTDLEYNILEYLLMNKQQVISPSQLFEAIWHEEYYYGANNTIMVHIRHLRQKIEKDPTNPEHIKTIWGKGYYCE